MTKEELDEVKSLIFDYIFPEPGYGVLEEMFFELKGKGFLELAAECCGICQDFAKDLIDEKLKEKEE